jgi:hypothetical protein
LPETSVLAFEAPDTRIFSDGGDGVTQRVQVLITLVATAILLSSCGTPSEENPFADPSWRHTFGVSECSLASSGRNTYFVLEPGFRLVLSGGSEKLQITVLAETRRVAGITTRVVEEREWKDGELIEVSRNFFAICPTTRDVFYFGEEVDDVKDGQVVGHTGAWLAGTDGARAGLIMPGDPKVGMKYYQEIAPDVAMDRAEILSLDETLETPAGVFSNSLKTQEGTPLNTNEKEFKTYAPKIGIIQDERLLLTGYGFIASQGA